ncbi:H+-ATPase G subunit-domain-containing protein [Xylaria castorea]|nr:H+-ATPase G subunit-domain-containing protein [Xylaria castorea]
MFLASRPNDLLRYRQREKPPRLSKKLVNMLLLPIVRTKRVREARDEAKKEIEAYRQAKDEEFKKFEAEHTKGNKQAEDEANKEADGKIKEIQASGKKSQAQVIEDMLKGVLDVNPVPPSAE